MSFLRLDPDPHMNQLLWKGALVVTALLLAVILLSGCTYRDYYAHGCCISQNEETTNGPVHRSEGAHSPGRGGDPR